MIRTLRRDGFQPALCSPPNSRLLMETIIRQAGVEDIEAICTLLHEKMNKKIPISRWRQRMTYPWLENKPDFGRVVESDGKVLGFCGMVYADRLIADAKQGPRKERIVSMSSWYLDKSLRGRGLGRDMLISSIQDPSLTYVILTNSKKPLGIVKALGFRVLEDHRHIWRKQQSSYESSVQIVTDIAAIRLDADPVHKGLLEDMDGYALMPVSVQSEGRQALMFFSVKKKRNDTTWCDLMYASDLELFSESAQHLADKLLPEKAALLAADGRFVRPAAMKTTVEQLPVSRHFISQRVQAHEIDHLYCELQLLDLKLD